MTHEEKDDSATDVTDKKMTKLNSTETSRNKAIEYVEHIIADHYFVNGETLYYVRRYE